MTIAWSARGMAALRQFAASCCPFRARPIDVVERPLSPDKTPGRAPGSGLWSYDENMPPIMAAPSDIAPNTATTARYATNPMMTTITALKVSV